MRADQSSVNPDNATTALPQFVTELRRSGLDVPMLTGDDYAAALEQAQIDPQHKAQIRSANACRLFER